MRQSTGLFRAERACNFHGGSDGGHKIAPAPRLAPIYPPPPLVLRRCTPTPFPPLRRRCVPHLRFGAPHLTATEQISHLTYSSALCAPKSLLYSLLTVATSSRPCLLIADSVSCFTNCPCAVTAPVRPGLLTQLSWHAHLPPPHTPKFPLRSAFLPPKLCGTWGQFYAAKD